MLSIKGSERRGWRRGAAVLSAIALMILAACEVPEAPEWDVGVSVPFSSDPITVVDFLPAAVDTATLAGQPAFVIAPQADSVTYTLETMCPACVALDGVVAPVPSFDYQDSLDVLFDTDLASLEIVTAQIELFAYNGLNFDPLRPGNGGFVAITVRDLGTGAMLDSVLVDGNVETLAPGTRHTILLDVSDAEISQGLRLIFNVHSPDDGQTVQIDKDMSVTLGGILDQLAVAAITAVVDARLLDQQFLVDFDEDIRSEIAERVQQGIYELELIHNVEIAGTLGASIAGTAADLFSGDPSREIRLDALTFESDLTQTGELTVADIQKIAEFVDVYVGYRGNASGTRPGNLARFTPGQAIETEFKVSAVVRVGN